MAWPLTPFQFTRDWPNKPTLLYPPNSTSVGDPFYYQWTPVRWATRYQLDVGTDPGFSPGTYATCFTAATTFVPTSNVGRLRRAHLERALLASARSRRPDRRPGHLLRHRTIDYNPGIVTQMSPVGGATVQSRRSSWSAARDAEKYRVGYWNTSSPSAVTSVDTTR